ncbi:MAG: SLC13 family permease, partial [Acidobacteriota bacterium]
MTLEMVLLSAIIVAAVACFALETYPVDKVSVLVLSALVLFRLVSPEEAIAGFGNSATVTVACMLALSYGIQSTGGLNYVANRIVDLAGANEFKILLSIIAAVGFLSAFINNTAAGALFLPLTIAVARQQRLDASKFLMPMSFAAMFAGSCTLIGTSTNLLVYSSAGHYLGWEIGIFEVTPAGLIFSAVGVLYLLLFAHRLLPSRRTGDSLTEEYRLRHFVTELILQDDSPLIGLTIAETEFREKYDVEVIEILRGGTRLLPTAQQTRLEPGDILLAQGDPHTLMELQDQKGVILKALTVEDQDLEDENIVLVEAFISPASRLIESTLKEINFRSTFKANALAIRSHGRSIREKIGKIKLEYGDSLLILTNRGQLEVLRQTPDFLVLEEVRSSFLRNDKVYYAVGIFLGIVLLAAFDIFSIV